MPENRWKELGRGGRRHEELESHRTNGEDSQDNNESWKGHAVGPVEENEGKAAIKCCHVMFVIRDTLNPSPGQNRTFSLC